jgi:hypothetical protein
VNNPPTQPTAAEDLRGSIEQTTSDLAEVADRLPGDSTESEPVARILDRLAEECAEAAAGVRALPGRPREEPGHTFAAVAAITTAAGAEHDLAGWLANVLATVAARLGSTRALVAGRPGSWEAGLVLGLVQGTVGPDDEALGDYRDGAS